MQNSFKFGTGIQATLYRAKGDNTCCIPKHGASAYITIPCKAKIKWNYLYSIHHETVLQLSSQHNN